MSYLKNETHKWHLSKHRYLELVHWCLQYPEWQQRLRSIDILKSSWGRLHLGDKNWQDETNRIVFERSEIINRIELIQRMTREADPDLASYIFVSVTEGMTFPQMAARIDIPCGKDMFYDRRRKFFWLLDKVKG